MKNRVASYLSPFASASPAARRTGISVVCVLAVILAMFSVAHLAHNRDFLASPLWHLSRDGGYGEYYQYSLLALSAAAFAYLSFRLRIALYAVIAAILIYLGLDDALRLHEQAGELYQAAGLASPVGALLPKHFGELVYLAPVGLTMLCSIALSAREAPSEARHAGLTVALLILGIGFFSAGVDTIHTLTDLHRLGVVEDAGEIMMVSLIAAFAAFLIVDRTTDDRVFA